MASAIKSNANLISSENVQGTTVFDTNAKNIGEIDHLMIDKISGRVLYALMSFGGFLGMGSSYHPLPWNQLVYEPGQGGYVVDLTREQLEGAPTYTTSDEPLWDDPTYRTGIDDYYRPYNRRL